MAWATQKGFSRQTIKPLHTIMAKDTPERFARLVLFELADIHALVMGIHDYIIVDIAHNADIPVDLLGPMGKSPIHVPLEANISASEEDSMWKGAPLARLRELWRQEGVANQLYVSQSAFWIIHHEAIETVYDLAMAFWNKANHSGLTVDVSAALGYAMQMLCADPEAHLLVNHPDLWASDEEGHFRDNLPDGVAWSWRHPLRPDAVEIRPSIIHLPRSKELLAASPQTLALCGCGITDG
jgi:hypothetical protein